MKNQYKYVSYAIRLDTRRKLSKSDLYPTKLELYIDGKKKRYDTGLPCSDKDWQKIKTGRFKDSNLKTLKDRYRTIENKVKDILDTLGNTNLSFESFELLYLGSKAKSVKFKQNIYDAFNERIEEFKSENRIGTALIYKDTLVALKKYAPELKYEDITVAFLWKYHKYLIIEKQYSYTTVSIYMRCLRAIINRAIACKLIPQEHYPFGKEKSGKYEICSPNKRKIPLPEKEIKAIIHYIPKNEIEAKTRDFWLFSYFCNGMNMADIFNLKYKNIKNGFLYFIREKTKRTCKQPQSIELFIIPPAMTIIERWGNKEKNPDNYIFDVYNKDLSYEENYKKGRLFLRVINDHLKEIGNELKLSETLTTYVARYSWGTSLMRKGVSLAYVSKGYGHTSFTTTEGYLGDFTQEQKIETSEILLDIAK